MALTAKMRIFVLYFSVSSAEKQKGINTIQQYSIENQKGIIAIDFVQQYHPSSSQRNIELW